MSRRLGRGGTGRGAGGTYSLSAAPVRSSAIDHQAPAGISAREPGSPMPTPPAVEHRRGPGRARAARGKTSAPDGRGRPRRRPPTGRPGAVRSSATSAERGQRRQHEQDDHEPPQGRPAAPAPADQSRKSAARRPIGARPRPAARPPRRAFTAARRARPRGGPPASSAALQRVAQQARDRHRPDAAGHRRDRAGDLGRRGEVDVAREAVVGAVHADVDHDRAGLDPVAADQSGAADRGDEHVGAPAAPRPGRACASGRW